jgi:hypothetical protein
MHSCSSIDTWPTLPLNEIVPDCAGPYAHVEPGLGHEKGSMFGEGIVIDVGETNTPAALEVELTEIGTLTELAPSTTVKVQLPADSGAMVYVCAEALPPALVVMVAIPAQALVSGTSVPLEALMVAEPDVPPTNKLTVPPPEMIGLLPPPTTIPTEADWWPKVITNVQLPLFVGVTV